MKKPIQYPLYKVYLFKSGDGLKGPFIDVYKYNSQLGGYYAFLTTDKINADDWDGKSIQFVDSERLTLLNTYDDSSSLIADYPEFAMQ